MKTLCFTVNGQILEKDSKKLDDFNGIVRGTQGYLRAHFEFSREWDGLRKVVGFQKRNIECEPKLLDSNNCCDIPDEACKGRKFTMWVIGLRDGMKITTNKIEIVQKG